MRMYRKLLHLVTVVGFAATVMILFLLTVLGGTKKSSVYENRPLAQRPEYSKEALLDGSYFNALEDWLSDQLIVRDAMLRAYTWINMDVLKKPVVNEVYLGEGVLLPYQKPQKIDFNYIENNTKEMGKRLKQLNDQITAYGGTFLYVGIPEQRSALREYYPKYLYDGVEELNIIEETFFNELERQGVPYLDMRSEFLAAGTPEYYYSRVDHHYNMKGALFTYQKVLDLLADQVEGIDLEQQVQLRELPNPYYGSRNRKLYDLYPNIEHAWVPDEPVPFTRTDDGVAGITNLCNLPVNNRAPVSYSIYMYEDMRETIIDTQRPELPSILIFGDSFTNPLEALFYRNFNQMHSLDLRGYQEMTLSEYVEQYQPEVVLCVRDDTLYLDLTGNGEII